MRAALFHLCGALILTSIVSPADGPPLAQGYPSVEASTAALGQWMANPPASRALPESISLTEGLAYSEVSAENKLDLYRSKDHQAALPVAVFIHGGAWLTGGRRDYRNLAIDFAEKGYACLSVDYRLSSEAPYPAAIDDIRAVLRWMAAHKAEYGLDVERVALIGGSAGAHLAMLAAYEQTERPVRIRAVVDFYGPTDLTADVAKEHPAVRAFLGKPFAEAKERYRQASPITHLDAADPPTLVLHGSFDNVVPISQSEALVARLKSLQVEHEFERWEGWPHLMDLHESAYRRCAWKMEGFLERHMKVQPLAKRD